LEENKKQMSNFTEQQVNEVVLKHNLEAGQTFQQEKVIGQLQIGGGSSSKEPPPDKEAPKEEEAKLTEDDVLEAVERVLAKRLQDNPDEG
jgi:hypothetical protein